jgi:hypothetical protein
MNILNAKISGTTLGFEDHGIFTCMIHLDYDGAGQSFGGYCFDIYDEKLMRRIGNRYGVEFMMELLNTVGVLTWEELKGSYVRVRQQIDKVHAIGHITKDKWFDPVELLRRINNGK